MSEHKTCHVTAGLCPKPEHTYGEPHYCDRPDFHHEQHRCRCCGMDFNADSVFLPTYLVRRHKIEATHEFAAENPRWLP